MDSSGIGNSKRDIITHFFRCGYQYKDILELLRRYHDISISMRTLHRLLKEYGLKRKCADVSTSTILDKVRQEIQEVGENRGYRSIYQHLIEKGIQIPTRLVRAALKELDPSGVERRTKHRLKRRVYRTNGPNDVWHIDGNDKLKPFGFCIHGGIDGFSRKIIWLAVSDTNKNPFIIAHYYTSAVKTLCAVPKLIRGDRGTENVNVCGIQRFLRRNHHDSWSGWNSFKYGKSVSNQRIEQWWSYLKRNTTQSWIDYFKDLRDQGLYDDSNNIHVEALKFCYYGLIQLHLDQVKHTWNHHKIRSTKYAESPSGRPDLMFFLPHNYNAIDCAFVFNADELELAESMYSKKPRAIPCQNEFIELSNILMEEQNLQHPRSREEAEHLYLYLVSTIEML